MAVDGLEEDSEDDGKNKPNSVVEPHFCVFLFFIAYTIILEKGEARHPKIVSGTTNYVTRGPR